jgi:NAD+ diphosphatase
MINEIFPHNFDNHYQQNRQIEPHDFVLHYKDNSLLLKMVGDDLHLPRKKDFLAITEQTETTFLFSLDEVSCYLVWDELPADNVDFSFKEISFFRTASLQEVAWVSIVGYHLWNWYSEHRYCGKCGTKTEHKTDERAMHCPNCGTLFFPKISPAIIVAITCNDKLLLARNSAFQGAWYSLIAGYVDVGETLEETVKREVKEEVGLEVKNIRYCMSQPWPLSGSMMIGFVAEAVDNQEIRIDGKEIAEAAWFGRDNLPNHPPAHIGISGVLIDKFEKGEL